APPPSTAVRVAGRDTGIEAEARALIGAVLELDTDVGRALVRAFAAGYLDVPYCLHPDNAGRARSSLGPDGRLSWSGVGSMPIAGLSGGPRPPILGSAELLTALSHVQRTYDARAAAGAVARSGGTTPETPRTPAARRELGLTSP
ncbi:amino acid--tRNA ligase-related protein, partial [Kitasatospora sp. NPDC001574]